MQNWKSISKSQSEFPPASSLTDSPLQVVQFEDAFAMGLRLDRHFVLAGPPLGENAWKKLEKWAQSNHIFLMGYYGNQHESELITSTRAGTSSIVKCDNYSRSGKKAEAIRRALNSGRRHSLDHKTLGEDNIKDLKRLFQKWSKRWAGPRIGFLLPDTLISRQRLKSDHWSGVFKNQKLVAAVGASDYSNGRYFHTMMFDPNSVKLAMDFAVVKALEACFESGTKEVSLGFNAYHQTAQGHTRREKILSHLFKLSWPYNSQGILNFKRKFGSIEIPRYMYWDRRTHWLRQVPSLISATYARAQNKKSAARELRFPNSVRI